MEFRILGPVEVHAAGRRLSPGHAKQQSVLAVLLLRLGHPVPPELLIDRVWGDRPPSSVRNLLYGYVAKLKTVLACAGEPDAELSRRPGGYLLQASQEQVDLYRFRRAVAAAGAAAGDDDRAALLRGALGLWQGMALSGLASPWLCAIRETLTLERVTASRDLHDTELRLGRHAALIGELSGEAVAYPADERLIGQLMLALYRSGRPAESLRWFEQTRQYLASEFGTDPGPALRELHQRILRYDPALSPAPAAAVAEADGARPVPRQLPADVPAFCGRTAELTELDRLSGPQTADADGSGAVVISTVSGTAGVGKTALAIRWAHRAAGRFPDGQLYVNLRGYDPGQPMAATDALAGFLHALGVPGRDVPAAADERAARYRSLLAGQRMLIVLDNAASVEQVRPLLPGTPGCLALVTSRDSMAGLVARNGARRVDLDLLPLDEAVGLLRTLIGTAVDDDQAAAQALAQQCARLPLALRVAAELAVARTGAPLADLVTELADQHRRLDLLEAGGDTCTAVRAVFSWSYRHLGAPAAATFRMLGLHPGTAVDSYAADALTGMSLGQAGRALGELARAHLIQPAGPHHHTLHDLLRSYSRELGATLDSEAARRSALTRLFDYYLETAAAAMDTLFPAERRRRPRIPAGAAEVPAVDSRAAAAAWLDAERANLVAATVHAEAHGWARHTTRLAATLFTHFETRGLFPEAITVHRCARAAASRTGDRSAEAAALTGLGFVDLRQGRYPEAADHLRQALTLFQDTGDTTGQARALGNLGNISVQLGHYQQAVDQLLQSQLLFRLTGDQTGQARALGNLGFAELRRGSYQEAACHLRQAVTLSRQAGDRSGEARALINRGIVEIRQGRYQQAATSQQQALALFRETSDRTGAAYALTNSGIVEQCQGNYAQAADHHQEALALFRETGNRSGEAEALNGLGEAVLGAGRPRSARTSHDGALGLATQIGDQYQQARAHNGLAHCYQALADFGLARHHWQQALAIFTGLGTPEAEQTRAQLASAPCAS